MIHKNSKRYWSDRPWSSAMLEKYEKVTLMDALKLHFHRFLMNQMELISTHWHRLWHFCKFMCFIFRKATQPLDFIKSNVTQKLAYKVKNILVKLKELDYIFQKFENKIRVLSKCHRSTDNFIDFYLFIMSWRLMITKNLVVKIQNFFVNHESRPLKSKPDIYIYIYILYKYIYIYMYRRRRRFVEDFVKTSKYL